jgi:hypothetical protein
MIAEQKRESESRLAQAGVTLPQEAYVFFGDPLGSVPWNPDWVTHKIADVASSAGAGHPDAL